MKIGRKDHENNGNWGLDPEKKEKKKRFVRLRDELTVKKKENYDSWMAIGPLKKSRL